MMRPSGSVTKEVPFVAEWNHSARDSYNAIYFLSSILKKNYILSQTLIARSSR